MLYALFYLQHLLYECIPCCICSMRLFLVTSALCVYSFLHHVYAIYSLIHLLYACIPCFICYMRVFLVTFLLCFYSLLHLPCGTGSCQNRRLREQTLTRKPCHCGSIKSGWCMEFPTSLDQPLQGQIVCACLDMFLPVWDLYLFPERVSLVTCKSQRHFKIFC